MFWLLIIICSTPQFRTDIYLQTELSDIYKFSLSHLMIYPLTIIMLLLYCFADSNPSIYHYKISEVILYL